MRCCEIKCPWQAEDAAHTIPDAPRWLVHYSAEVKLLQKCLLKLGFLRTEHIDKLVGHYQDISTRAVTAFRDAYDVPDDENENEVYCSKTAQILAKVLDLSIHPSYSSILVLILLVYVLDSVHVSSLLLHLLHGRQFPWF